MSTSVIVLVYNSEKTLRRCLNAVLKQSYKEFELIIVDDGSTDRSKEIVKSFDDERIKFFENEKNLGIAKSRNVGLKNATGELIFFTDSDCIPLPTWLETGINSIGNHDFITGWTLYENSYPSFRERVVQGKDVFFTCNMGFKKSSLMSIGGFNENYSMNGEDKEVSYKIIKNGGTWKYNEDMKVIHQQVFRTKKREWDMYVPYFKSKLLSQITYKREADTKFRIIRPDMLIAMFFPPWLLLTRPIKSWEDLKIVPFTWGGLTRGRIHMWKDCIKMKKFYL